MLRLLEILKPDHVFMMEVYFDESGTHDNSPVMCVAGYLFAAEQAVRFDDEWRSQLSAYGLSHFHTADCAHGTGECKGMSRADRSSLYVSLINIIKRRATIGIAISVSETDFGCHEPPKWELGGPYLIASLFALSGVVSWAEKHRYSGKISYFFESGHKHEAQANTAINLFGDRGKAYMRYHSHTFIGKNDASPIQAADVLAYEWQKELRRINLSSDGRSMRRSLMSLLQVTHITQHYSASDIQLFSQGPEAIMKNRKLEFNVVQ